MTNPERKLKIYSLYRSTNSEAVPELRLAGAWLNRLGFSIGEKVKIITREKLIIIQPESNGNQRH